MGDQFLAMFGEENPTLNATRPAAPLALPLVDDLSLPEPARADEQPAVAGATGPDDGAWQCPRCHRRMETHSVDGVHLHACPTCAGVMVERASVDTFEPTHAARLADWIAAHESKQEKVVDGRAMVYLHCPRCSGPMARQNFMRCSGVIVDSCMGHGTWFDAAELTAALAFIAQGGAVKTVKFEQEQAKFKRPAMTEQEMNQPRYRFGYHGAGDALTDVVLDTAIDSFFDW